MKQDCKTVIRDPNDLPDFSKMTPEQEAVFWESCEVAPEVFETGDDVDADLDVLLGLVPADKH